MLYDVKTTRKLEKKIISQDNTELSLMFKALNISESSVLS